MILLDANLLIYANVTTMPEHARARAWLEDVLSSGIRVGLPWPSLLAFLRIVTNPRVFAAAVDLPRAWKQVATWLEVDTVYVPQPTERHAAILGVLLAVPGATAKMVPDAHLAALAIEHGLTLQTHDSGFARFPGLAWSNPLA